MFIHKLINLNIIVLIGNGFNLEIFSTDSCKENDFFTFFMCVLNLKKEMLILKSDLLFLFIFREHY